MSSFYVVSFLKKEYYIKKKLRHTEKKQLIENKDAFKCLISQKLQEISYKRIENITLESCLAENNQKN